MVEQAMIGFDEVTVPFGRRQACPETGPLLGKHGGYAAIKPVDLRLSGHGDAMEEHLRDPIGVALGVGKGQGCAPGAAE